MRDTDRPELVHRLIRELATREDAAAQVTVLVVTALLGASPDDLLDEAGCAAATTADRQFVAIAVAHLAGDHERVDALVRDHLLDHTAGPVLTWITDRSRSIATDQGALR